MPVIPEGEYLRSIGSQHSEGAPTDLRTFLARANDPFGPVEERVRIPSLLGHIHFLKPIIRIVDDRPDDLPCAREASVAIFCPLHRCTRALTFREPQIVPY